MNDKTPKNSLPSTLLRVAWLSILLGIGMELLLLAAGQLFGHNTEVKVILADLVQKISWSTFVCTGVALGLAAGKMRPKAMGLAGLIAAPVAFYVAKTLHKSASQALAIAGQVSTGGPAPLVLVCIKALEYAVLGFLIGRLGKKPSASLKEHILYGVLIGVVFGGTIVTLMITQATPNPLPLFAIITRCINEIVFPVGCSFVLYTAQKLGEKSAKQDVEPDAA